MKKTLRFLWRALGLAYYPVYAAAWLLHKGARLLLALAYFGMLRGQEAKDIVKHLFMRNGRF